MELQPRGDDTSSCRSNSRSTSVRLSASSASSSPPHQSVSSASVSRASQRGLGAAADSLLRSRLPSNSFSAIATDHTSSVSRSQVSQNGLGATVDSLLRSPIHLSSSVASPTSASRTKARQIALKMNEDAQLRSSVSRDMPSSATSALSRGVPASSASVPPSYRSSQPPSFRSSQPPAYKLDNQRTQNEQLSVEDALDGGDDNARSITAAESKRRIRQVQQAVADASATAPAKDNEGLFQKLSSADLLFLIDTTSSMMSYIEAAKDQVRSIMTDIQRTYLGESVVRMAIIGYKDHCNNPNVEFLDFTTSVDEARNFLGNLRAQGGEGWTADALGGLQQATNATWKQPTRCIIHIADAPAHSCAMHDMTEQYDCKYYTPGSEPHGLTYQPVMGMLVKLGINYTFLHIHNCTDRMTMVFSRIYDVAGADSQLLPTNKHYDQASATSKSKTGGSAWSGKRSISNSSQLLFQELSIGIDATSLRRLVLKSVTDSVTRTSSRHSLVMSKNSIGNPGSATCSPRPSGLRPMLSAVFEGQTNQEIVSPQNHQVMQLEKDPPQWDSPGWLDKKWDLVGFCPEVVVYSDSTLADMMASDDNIKLSFVQLTIQARSVPFDQGAQRVASYARIAGTASKFVSKSYAHGGMGLAHMIEDMRMQALCKAFALEFNGLVRSEQAIDFVVTACLHKKTDAATATAKECLSFEPYLAGEYTKYNSNGLFVKPDTPNDPVNPVAQAFSHYTFERSWGEFMVVDLQGVGNTLTDPAIHTLDPERFKLHDLNCNGEGFKFFFAKHECNEVCQQLGLVSNRDMAIPGNWQFRRTWPSLEPTVCCSTKFCQTIIRVAGAKMSSKLPGYRWCNRCWVQLEATTSLWICAGPGDSHKFEMCRFFYVSQGKLPPRTCPQHTERDKTALTIASVGGSLWSKLKTGSKKMSVLGNEY